MRPIPSCLAPFSSREVFLMNCIRDLEKKITALEERLWREGLLACETDDGD